VVSGCPGGAGRQASGGAASLSTTPAHPPPRGTDRWPRSRALTTPPNPLLAILAVVEEWGDQYSQLANYLRLNGLQPPTAKKGQG
jgi:hypothetical protein